MSAASILDLEKLLPFLYHRQHGRQGLAVLVASALILIKHETSTHRQSCHNFLSNDFKFGVGDYVREVITTAKVGSDSMIGQDATWGQHTRVLTFFCFFVLLFFNRATAHTREPIFAYNKLKRLGLVYGRPFRG